MDARVMRDLSSNSPRSRMLDSNGDFAGLGDEAGDWCGAGSLAEEPVCGADGRVPREGDFTLDGEDVDCAFCGVGYRVDEDGFGEVEFQGEDMFLALGELLPGVFGEEDYCQWVAAKRLRCEDVESYKFQLSHGGLGVER